MINNPKNVVEQAILGVILAGGQSTRFGGGHKFLSEMNGKPLINHIIERVDSQTGQLIINTNDPTSEIVDLGLPVVVDSIRGHIGPLAGVLAGMEWALKNVPNCKWIVSYPSDSPFIPFDFVSRLLAKATNENLDVVCAASGSRIHPVCGLWNVHLCSDLRTAIIEEKARKIDLWTSTKRSSIVTFSNKPYDPFFNINNRADLVHAEKILRKLAV